MRNGSLFSILLTAVSTSWAVHIIQAVCGLTVLPLLVSHLGKTEYGIWVLIVQAVSFLSMSDFGVASSTGRFVARFRGLKQQDLLRKLYSTLLVLMIFFGIIVVLITLILSPWIPTILGIGENYKIVTINVFIITGLSVALQFPLKISIGILTGHQLYGPHGIGKIAVPVINLTGVLVLLYTNRISLINVSLIFAFSALFAQFLLMVVAYILTKPWKLSLRFFSFKLVKDILSLGGSSLVMSSSQLLYRSGLGIAVGRILGVETAGIYGVALTLISHIQPLISSFSTPFTTLASEFQAKKTFEKFQGTIINVMKITFSLSASAAAGLFIYGEHIIRLLLSSAKWTSMDYHHAGISLVIMGVGMAIGLPQVISQSTLRGIGKHWQVSYAFLIVSIISLIFSIIAMKYGFGIYGAALGWSLFWALQGILFYPVMICKALNYSIFHMIAEVYIPGACIGMFVLFISYCFDYFLKANNIINLVIGISISALLGCIAILITSGYCGIVWNKVFGYLRN
jgi:O-antigen/teichoic acid export membrane protein